MSKKFVSFILTVLTVIGCFTFGTSAVDTFDPVFPLNDSNPCVSCWGYYSSGKAHKSSGYGNNENAIDFVVSSGTEVYAIESGKVSFARWDTTGYGKRITLTHDNGEKSLYGHLSKIIVEEGDTVSRGQIIAYSGSTGDSSGPHLHFAYSGNNLFRNYWLPQLYEAVSFKPECRSANAKYNDDKFIVNLIDDCYCYQSGKYVYSGSSLISKYLNITDTVHRVKMYQTAVVTAKSGLTVRKAPNIDSQKIGVLKSGATVRIVNYPVTDAKGYTWRWCMDANGFVCESYLNINTNSGNIILNGTYRIQASNGKFLTYCEYETARNGSLILWERMDDCYKVNQWFIFTPLFYFDDCGTIGYRISPAYNSSFALDCGTSPTDQVHLAKANNSKSQEWILEVNADGSVRFLQNRSRLVFDVSGGSDENGTPIILYGAHGEDNQRFQIVEP